MKKKFGLGLLVLLLGFASCSFTENHSFETDNKDKLLIDLITYVLEKGHYSPKDLDDQFSTEAFSRFIKGMDPLKRYFLASDIETFEKYRLSIDDQLINKELVFFDEVYKVLSKRIEEAESRYERLLSDSFDLFSPSVVEIDYDQMSYVNTKAELEDRWRQQLTISLLPVIDAQLEKYARENELEVESIEESVLLELQVKAREELKRTFYEYFHFIGELDREDYFSTYINAVVETFDPHTYYFAPTDKDRFDIAMSGKFEGIGARLQKKPEGTTVVEIISGGPVWRAKSLEVGDELLKVRQEEGEAVDISGMRLDDAIELIKGPEGTTVYLTVKRTNGVVEEISVIRDVVELEESYAKSVKISDEEYEYGLIHLPKFYVDFDDYNQRNAAIDVKAELMRLQKEGVEGVVLDLRDNGGGSLQTVVDMAGYFIDEGPVVQVRTAGDRREVQKDPEKGILYDGPLVVLVNELSASASEILAAALQDYGRAVIIGSERTYGKGTVQNVIPLSNIIRSNELGDLGALKITTQKFYRVSGGSTQLEGVSSDIIIPDRYTYIDVGERDQDNPLSWDRIQAATFTPWHKQIDYERILSSSRERLSANRYVDLLDEEARWISAQREDDTTYLDLKSYRKNKEELKKKSKEFEALDQYDTRLKFSSLPYEKSLFNQDSILREKRDRWHKELAKDVYLEEAIAVLKDLKRYTYNRPSPIKG
jgi:carboxyl-terminal processing protease